MFIFSFYIFLCKKYHLVTALDAGLDEGLSSETK